ncbi:MAG: regulatory protein GemA [Emcibacter sp.]|nr:regulatory protein GemA [Emcibacter sp.]
MSNRKSMFQKIHIAKKDLGLSDDDYRFTLETVTGRNSCADMSDRQLAKILDHFKSKGWKPKKRKKSKHAEVRMVYALWWDLFDSGKLDCAKSQVRSALQKFVQNLTGIDNPEWLQGPDASAVIEALKAMKKREKKL